jgi:superfamily II DNA or RNA helicase
MQWKENLENTFQIEIGEFTGNLKEIKPITVSTYDSALINAERLGNRFQLLIFDEVHHLPSESYKQIAEMFIAPYRLGLTATYERADEGHLEFPELIGDIVYEVSTAKLQGKYLAEYDYNKLILPLNEEEQDQYNRYNSEFKAYLQQHKLIFHTPNDFRKIVMRSGKDPKARQALLAHNMAEKIAFNSETKIAKLRELLSSLNRTIIFTRYNEMVYTISRQFLIPCITHHTKDQERKEIMTKFKSGEYRAIVCSQVLDEGIDVPEANVGIIMSGNGSPRSQIQRLGRLLRPQEGKRAQLWELISKGTKEMGTSQRRKLSEGK